MITPTNSAPVPMRKIKRAAIAMSVELVRAASAIINMLVTKNAIAAFSVSTALLLRNAVLTENAAIAFFVTSMFIIALAALTNSTLIAIAALFIFLIGTGALLVGVIITTLELSRSQREVAYEIQDGLKLRKEDLM